jgi:putative spermidine/putrescine transport system substrate-binding protein
MTNSREGGKAASRREFIIGGASAAAVLGLAACGSSSSGPSAATTSGRYGHGTFTIADWGGTSDTGLRDTWGKAFTQKTGWSFQTVVPVVYAKLVTQVESGHVQWDWIDSEGWFPYSQPEILAPLDYKTIGVTKDDLLYPEFWRGPNFIASYSTSYVIGYRTDRKGPVPQNWQEFFDPKSIPGIRMLYNYPYGTLELPLLGDGVPYDKLYPLDVERGLAKLKSMGSNLVYWNEAAQAQQALVSGSADFVVTWNNRIGYLGITGLPVGIMWNEHIHSNGMHIIPKGGPDKMCNIFIQTALTGTNQAALATAAGFAPTTKAGQAALDPSIVKWMNTTPANWNKGLGPINDEWWGTDNNYDKVYSQWTAAIAA